MAKQNFDSDKVQKCLTGISYPASKDELINHAKNTCGDEGVISMLKDLPEQSYGGKQDLTRVLSGLGVHLNVDL